MTDLTSTSLYDFAVNEMKVVQVRGESMQSQPHSGDDLIIWPDDDYCDADELGEYGHKSDDFLRIPVDSEVCRAIREHL